MRRCAGRESSSCEATLGDPVRKDFALVFDEARKNGAELPVTALVDQFYAEVQAMGGNRWDTSSLIALLQRKR